MIDLPVVDAHQHFWDPERNRNPWLCEQPPVAQRYGDYGSICRRYLPPDYLEDCAPIEVARSVYVEAEWDPDDPVGETRWVHEVAREHGYPHAMVAQAWLDRDDVADVLAAHAGFPLVRGVRHKPTVAHAHHAPRPGPRGSMSDERWRAGYAMLARHGFSFDLQVAWWHLPEAAALASDFPDTTIILDHTGLPPADRGEAGLAAWRDAMQVLAGRPNVACKISGLGRPGLPWTVESNRRVVLDAIEAFGVDRCMFASNYPVDRLCGEFAAIYGGFAEIVAHLDAPDRRKLFHDNAVRIYRMD